MKKTTIFCDVCGQEVSTKLNYSIVARINDNPSDKYATFAYLPELLCEDVCADCMKMIAKAMNREIERSKL